MWTFKKFGLMFDNLPCLSENKDFNCIYFTKYKRKIFLHSPPLRHFSILLFFPLKWLITSHVGSLGHRANVHHDLLKTQIETYHKSKWCSSFFCCDSIVFAINKIRRRKHFSHYRNDSHMVKRWLWNRFIRCCHWTKFLVGMETSL